MSKKNDTSGETAPNIMQDYLDITNKYKLQYGNNTLLLMQVGAFFEVYGLKDHVGIISGSQIEEFTVICQLNISEKKIMFNNQQVVMAGFRDYTLDKYLQRLSDAGYTTVVYVQEKEGKIVKRVFQGIYSSGTYLSYDVDSSPQMTNNIMCIWIDTFKPVARKSVSKAVRDTIIYGVSTINTFTGKSSLFEYQTPFIMNPTTFDELERYISVLSPNELIFLTPFDEKINNNILQYIGTSAKTVHRINTEVTTNDKVLNCTKQTYILQLISSFFGEDTYNVCREFDTHTMATQSLCYLLNFVKEHNINLVRKICIPEFNNTTDRLILANHTLKQLNIIDDTNGDGKNNGKLSSVLTFLNKCSSPMGRRRFQTQLLNPITNVKWLNEEYTMISEMLNENNYHFIELVRKQLTQVRDIEKICRQIVIKKIYPSSLYHLYNSIKVIQQLNNCFYENDELCHYLTSDIENIEIKPNVYINDICAKLLQYFDEIFIMENIKNINSVSNFDENIIRNGIFKDLDTVVNEYNTKIALFNEIRSKLNSLIKTNDNADVEYVKIHETEKSGLSLQITKTRAAHLKKGIKEIIDRPYSNELLNNKDVEIEVRGEKISFSLYDIKFISASTSQDEIDIPALNKISKEILNNKDKMNVILAETYLNIIDNIEKENLKELENLAVYIAKLDVLHCKTYIAKTYKYCRPEISDTDKSFVNAIGLRHCLIENLLQNELYEKNDVSLGGKTDGILLYGTNAVGKTSIIRALGISIIMAQSGMFVPCSQFVYKPYTSIYSRILGNDNIFKGLSTFAVEMSELRIILKMADEGSLILGDELCSGTETESALSIFVAGLMELHDKKSSFIFATHFHEIIHYDEIKSMRRLSIKHMSVIFDKEKDVLIYDRKLKDGPGIRTYGLEVCKSLYLSDEFLERAYSIRNKYYPETRGELAMKPSHFNSKKLVGVCELCKEELAIEVHHLQQQKDADENGFIGSFHKNHKANLLSVCEKCHQKLHHSQSGEDHITQRKKTTKGYTLA